MKVLITDEQSLFRDGLSLRLKQINQDIAILQSSNLVDMTKNIIQRARYRYIDSGYRFG